MKKIILAITFIGMMLVVCENAMAQRDCSNPGPDQVSLYVDANYKGGCVIYSFGNFNQINNLSNNVSSILVGSNVDAILCTEENFGGYCERFSKSDNWLGDNRIGNDTVSSFKMIRKPPKKESSTLNFGNATKYPISLYVRMNGKEKFFKTMPQNGDLSVQTYVGWVWVFKFGQRIVGIYKATDEATPPITITTNKFSPGLIRNRKEAEQKCNELARARSSFWTGIWTASNSQNSGFCELAKVTTWVGTD